MKEIVVNILKKIYIFVNLDQIYLYKKDNNWIPFMNRCFVKPIKNTNSFND